MFKTIRRLASLYKIVKQKPLDQAKKNVIYNPVLNGETLNVHLYTIRSWKNKFDALILKNEFKPSVGFRFVNRRGFSSFGFKEKVDVVICDIHHNVINMYTNFSPQKMTRFFDNARYIYVFYRDFCQQHNIQINDVLSTKKFFSN